MRKKNSIIAVCICSFVAICCLFTFQKEDIRIYSKQHLVFDNYVVKTYQKKNQYTVLITEGNYVKKKIVFSDDRQIIFSKNISLVENLDFSKFIGTPYLKVKESLGEPHCDCGSGLFYPSYITRDGYLVILSSNDNHDEIITSVVIVDLFSGTKTGDGLREP